MWFLSALAIICGYLFFDSFGIIIAAFVFICILLFFKADTYSKLVCCLVLSLPVSYIGVFGKGMSHIFSWYIGFLFLYTLYTILFLLKNKIAVSRSIVLIVLVIFLMLYFRNIFSLFLSFALIDLVQMAIMIIPITLCFSIHSTQSELGINLYAHQYINILDQVVFATSLSVVVQYFSYNFLYVETGFINVFPARTTYDLLFKGFSVLSIFLGIGIVINVRNLFDKFNLFSVLKIFTCLIAIAINTSRTGLISASLVVCLMLVIFLKNSKNKTFAIAICFFISMCCGIGLYIFANFRYDLSFNLFNDNGRFETYLNGLSCWTTSLSNFFFGVGISTFEVSFLYPHNFIIQTLMCCGLIVSSLIFLLIIALFSYMRSNKYKYIYWHILLSSMFITGFFESTHTTVCCIVIVATMQRSTKRCSSFLLPDARSHESF